MIGRISAPTRSSTRLSKYDYNALLISRAKRFKAYGSAPLRTKFTYVKLKRPPSAFSLLFSKVSRPFFR